ncbi:MAG: spermidine/putrescine ABC transporter substrate-binding protein [Anaerolineales bacterium]|nr:spermidine/putrescine ABC transporter substrate-binding protein [Anaerolineales bacterium]
MKKLSVVIFSLLIAVSLAACGSSGPKVLNFYTWSEYIDPEIYTMFEEETGIQVVEDTFGSNEDLLAKLQSGATGYDVIVPSDYMVETMIELGLLAELDHGRLENIGNLDPTFTNSPFDPNMGHCLPYFWGTTGIGFNWNDWDEAPDSWAYIFDPELAKDFEGQISLLDDMREAFGSALIYLGYSPNSTNEAELTEARELIMGILPYVHTFESDTYDDFLLTGETALAHGWSGDVFAAQVEDENIDYIIPKEGAVMWVDNLCITKDAAADPDRLEMAYLWLDFLNRPDIAAINTNFVWYASPNAAAESGILPEILEYPAIYPDEETFKRLSFLENVGDFTETYSRMWTEIKAGE